MNSELKEKLEDLISNEHPRIRTKRDYACILKIMEQAYNLDRTPSPSGGIKTATPFYEILNEKLRPLGKSIHSFDLPTWNAILNSADEFHNQFAGDGWIDVNDRLPEESVNIWGALQHWHTKNYRYAEIKKVVESDCDWRTCDDNSEISHNWTVTHWQPLPQKPQNTKES